MKYVLGIALIAILVGVWWFTAGPGNPEAQHTETATTSTDGSDTAGTPPTPNATATGTAASTTGATADGGAVKTVTINVSSSNFKFDPTTITVKKGDRVRVTLNNTGGTHDWVVDEFNAKTKQITGSGTDTVEFVADQAGTFEYYCSVGTHRQMGMVGKLIVE